MQYNRILLKLSGESLMGEQKYGIDTRCLESYARQIHEIAEMGRRAKKRVAEEYTWDKICRQYENVFYKFKGNEIKCQ